MDGSDAPDGHILDEVMFGQHMFSNSGHPSSALVPRANHPRPPQAVLPSALYDATPPPASYAVTPPPAPYGSLLVRAYYVGWPSPVSIGQWPGIDPMGVAPAGHMVRVIKWNGLIQM